MKSLEFFAHCSTSYGFLIFHFSLGMKDSMGPLKALLVASSVNGIGHFVLCKVLGYGIVGAAWATMASQVSSKSMFLFLFDAIRENHPEICE